MLVVQDAFHSSDLPRGAVCAIGKFDGFHRGQRALVESVVRRAEEVGPPAVPVPAVAITFDPHPLAVLQPERAPLPLTTPAQKERLLAEAGIAAMLVVRFDLDLARTPADTFVRDFLASRLGVREVWVGESFVFGHQREGDLDLLRSLGAELGFTAHGVDEVLYGGERISSSRIRHDLLAGQVEAAAEMLGRPYSIAGVIVRGDRMGHKLGWPTINLAPENKLLPADGVYATRVFFPHYPATFDSVTNVGTRPTIYENYQRVVESHILDFKDNVYNQQVEVQFFRRLREERMFPSVMDLSAQIGRDVESAREYFARRPEG
jgi:riboflavin kinase/FMN adenylyltransferase